MIKLPTHVIPRQVSRVQKTFLNPIALNHQSSVVKCTNVPENTKIRMRATKGGISHRQLGVAFGRFATINSSSGYDFHCRVVIGHWSLVVRLSSLVITSLFTRHSLHLQQPKIPHTQIINNPSPNQ